ncbi:MAG: hypothetical protein EZS28_008847 [Streblomastix strix]|uniref:Uncharacterized protein n=1 Tax=Streblomastix strix TaxID=222440 RepID=A0A5J4WLC3_9EUKA|nr:MAG: hypothetical protein EZS28_008847 [Streblomastix strix]
MVYDTMNTIERQKPQQYAGLVDAVGKFHVIMNLVIEEDKKKRKIMLPRQYKHFPNKDGHLFFYAPKNYHPTPISTQKDLNHSEQQ